MTLLSALVARLVRAPQTHGFGVQSPNDYHFLTTVLRAPLPADVGALLSTDKALARFLRLLFLIARARQPRSMLNTTALPSVETIVAYAAETCVACPADSTAAAALVVADAAATDAAATCRAALRRTEEGGCMVIWNIHRDKRCTQLWQQLRSAAQSVIAFDLYSAGVVMNSPQRYREHYKAYF